MKARSYKILYLFIENSGQTLLFAYHKHIIGEPKIIYTCQTEQWSGKVEKTTALAFVTLTPQSNELDRVIKS